MTFKLEYLQQNLAECATFSSKCLKESLPKIRYQQEALKYCIQTQSLNSDEQQVLLQWLYTKSQTQSDTIPTDHSKLVHDIWSSPGISALTSNKRYMFQKHPAAKTYWYIKHPKQILVKIQTEVYLEFKTGNQRLKCNRGALRDVSHF